MIGTTLGGYRILEQIGAGGMATVYKAYDPGMDRHVAVKVLPHQYAEDPGFRWLKAAAQHYDRGDADQTEQFLAAFMQ